MKSEPYELSVELERFTREINNHAELVFNSQHDLTEETRKRLIEDYQRISQMFHLIMEHTGSIDLLVKIQDSLPFVPWILRSGYVQMTDIDWLSPDKEDS